MIPPASLDDIKVLDLSQGVAGPLCAKILGDFGADVIKIEPPQGDLARRLAPFAGKEPHPEKSLMFLLANLNKRGLKLDLEQEAGKAIFRRLAAECDVIVESYKPGYLKSLGLDYESLAQDNPGLVMLSITPFGQTGPYAGWENEEIVTYALSGIMSISGLAEREPIKHGGIQAQYEGGYTGAVGVLTALYARDLHGEGQQVDLSLQDVVASTLIIHQPLYSWAGGVAGRAPSVGRGSGQVQPCKDGYFVWQPGGGAEWEDIAEFFALPEFKDPKFATLTGRTKNAAELDQLVLKATEDRTMHELFRTASEKYHMLFGIVQEAKDLANCEHLKARDFFEEVDHPVIGRIRVPFRLFNISEGAAEYRLPAPLLGQHSEEILQERLGLGTEEVASLKNQGVI